MKNERQQVNNAVFYCYSSCNYDYDIYKYMIVGMCNRNKYKK